MRPEDWDDSLIENIRVNDVILIRKCLFFGADVNKLDYNGNTPLANATKRGLLNVMQLLLSQDADIFKTGEKGKTPLHWAILRGHLEAVKLLLSNGISVNKTDQIGNVPLIYATQEEKIPIAEFLINKGADVNRICSNGTTPLSEAIRRGNLPLVTLLVSKGAAINNVDINGNTPIALATQSKHADIVKFLALMDANLSKFGEGKGKPPLSWAVINEDLGLVEFLLENGAESTMQLAFMEAVERGNFGIVKYFCEKGAVVGEAALQKAPVEIVEYFEELSDKIQTSDIL